MTSVYNIVGYVRISVDVDQDKDSISIENQESITADFEKQEFLGRSLGFFEDRVLGNKR